MTGSNRGGGGGGCIVYDIAPVMRLPDQSLKRLDVIFARKGSAFPQSGELS